jgi:L-alanine-DL-glutamate epimerase-like enolase superfamily enzyme
MNLTVRRVDWEFARPFRIAYQTRTHSETVRVELQDGEHVGRGEALGVCYRGETVQLLLEQLQQLMEDARQGLSREALYDLLPAGGARNALDCALWDLESKRSGCRAWTLARMEAVQPLRTAYTLAIDTPEAMSAAAVAARRYAILKLKLNGDADDLPRVMLTRRARPDARIVVDANQSWNERQLHQLIPQFANLGVKLVEQPLPVGKDEVLKDFSSPIPLCADESFQTAGDVPGVRGKYAYVNIKLDKTGGLTGALHAARAAREAGLKLMVGCMGGSSLSMAPAFVVGQWCDVVDLDAPLLAKSDVPQAIRYEGSWMFPPDEALWG